MVAGEEVAGDAEAFDFDAVFGLEGAGDGDADDAADHVEGDDPPEEFEDGEGVAVGCAGEPAAEHEECVEDGVEHADAEEEDAAEEGGDDFADYFFGADLHAGHEGDAGAGEEGEEDVFEVGVEFCVVLAECGEGGVEVGVGGDCHPHDEEAADEVAEEGVEPESDELAEFGAACDVGGGGDEEAFGEEFGVGEEEDDESEGEGDAAEELAAAGLGDGYAGEDAEADFDAAHETGDELLGAGAGEALATFVDLAGEGVVEGVFVVEGLFVAEFSHALFERFFAFFVDVFFDFGDVVS